MPSIAIYLTGIGIPDDIMQTVRDGLSNQTLPATIRSVDMYLSHVAETDRNRAIELKKDFVNRYLLSSGNKFNSIFGVRDSFEYLTYGDVIVRSDVMYVESAEDDPDAAILADMNGFDDLIETAEVPYPIWLVKFEIGRKHNHDWSHTEISPIGSDKESWEMQFTYLPGAERGYIRGVLPAKDATMEHIAKAEDELRERPLKGIAGIRKTTIRTEKKDIKLDDGTIVARDSARYSELAPISMDAETYIIDTIGSNLMEITSMDHVDPYRTFTNDITEMMAIYGIEVARRSIIRELNQVLIGAGIQIDIRHITLLADAMTCRGFIQKIDRFGAKKGESGPLALASFEETTAMLGMAAAQAETDTLGVSANIMVGQFVKLGTNSFETYLDENMLLQYAEKPAVARTLIDLTDNTDECNMEDLGRFEFVL
jgi:hypothetical protein